ncbi:MAG: xylose isomerase, partial [Bacteroidota bacterium]
MAESSYVQRRRDRYASFDEGMGAAWTKGQLGLTELHNYITSHGEPDQISGKQELFENLINQFI